MLSCYSNHITDLLLSAWLHHYTSLPQYELQQSVNTVMDSNTELYPPISTVEEVRLFACLLACLLVVMYFPRGLCQHKDFYHFAPAWKWFQIVYCKTGSTGKLTLCYKSTYTKRHLPRSSTGYVPQVVSIERFQYAMPLTCETLHICFFFAKNFTTEWFLYPGKKTQLIIMDWLVLYVSVMMCRCEFPVPSLSPILWTESITWDHVWNLEITWSIPNLATCIKLKSKHGIFHAQKCAKREALLLHQRSKCVYSVDSYTAGWTSTHLFWICIYSRHRLIDWLRIIDFLLTDWFINRLIDWMND